MKKAELVFVPVPGMGHLVSTVEIAKILVAQDQRLSISILIIKLPGGSESKVNSYIQSLSSSISERIKFIELPENKVGPSDLNPTFFISTFYENLKPHVRNAVKNLVESWSGRPDSPRLAGFVVDMFSTAMIDVADEFGVPSYVFFTSGAGFLCLMAHLQDLSDDLGKDITEYSDQPDAELVIPGFVNPVPAKVFPGAVLDKDASPLFLGNFRKMRKTKGLLVNTFTELEFNMIRPLSQGEFPPIYPVGPILNLKTTDSHVGLGGTDDNTTDVVTWLDSQPPSSVVYLCFGSSGTFSGEQVREIACALEHTGVRFLWSLRKPPPSGGPLLPSDYKDVNEVLPEGFLDRAAEIGKIIGWAPQVTVLAHPSIGGFVSHCGWNSTLESLWFGVPMATWPLAAEQQINAFKMVREFGLAVEIKLDYRKDFNSFFTGNDPRLVIVKAEEIEKGIMELMDQRDTNTRKRVKEMSEKSRKALLEGGSSYSSLYQFISDVLDNMP
ncbi:UDP-glucuronosyl/UDP-glucosyltransferase [Parasponia andersonii]|uniref:Glycosyltransferase n=1 Tax=Parasponia andersonii TaxID=3476 RepID=A0A2P5AQD6_PARAD|nr:UDP-glucuronosyl/UDP-glucosyltransferase [Parasponia andersonii]